MSGPINSEIIINDTNLNSGIVNKEYQLIYSNYFWHKVYVLNAIKYSRDFVLRTIMKSLHPYDFIPVCYKIEGEYVTFMLKNCGDAINQLCRLNLIIPYPDSNKNVPAFKMAIGLKHAHASELKIEIQMNIANILKRRYNAQTKTLNLEAFVEDPDLIEFCPLSQPKLLYFVLHLSRDFEIECLKLNYNEIEVLKPLEALQPDKNSKNLTILDLQRNRIGNVQELQALKLFPLTEVALKDNPFYLSLSEQEYIKLVKEMCANIVKIDGVTLPPVGMVSMKRNYLCNELGQNFVDQFLEHFFTLYDSHNRHILSNMYDKEALFSITSQYSNDVLGTHEKLFEFKKYSRNIKTLSDLSKGHENIYIGPTSIANMFKILPESEHDPYTFTVDLMNLTETHGMISVTGVFKEPGQNLLAADYYFSFTRTFILNAVSNMEYKIINEMLHVSNASTDQQENAFKIIKIPHSVVINVEDAKTMTEKNEMINAFIAITNFRPEWAAKLLKEFGYNFKKSVGMFMELYKADKLPSIAFDDDKAENSSTTPNKIGSQRAQSIQPINKMVQIKTTSNVSSIVLGTPSVVQPPIVSSTSKPSVLAHIPTVQSVQRKPETKSKSRNLVNLPDIKTINPQSNQETVKIVVPVVESKKINVTETIDLVDTPSGLPLIQPTIKPNIKINIQKPHAGSSSIPAVSPAKSPDSSDVICIDISNLKKYINDPLILRVLSMSIDTPIDRVKENFEAACQQVLKHYTCAIKYYKAIGREFYRFQLFADARNFLAKAMAIIPKKMGEQLYCVFTLFEIQYGDMNVAENMILIIAETLEENKAAIFLTETVSKINIGFSRKVFDTVASSALAANKKLTLLKAHLEFEKSHGNIDSVKHATKLLQEANRPTTSSTNKLHSEQKNETSVPTRENTVPSNITTQSNTKSDESTRVSDKNVATHSLAKPFEKYSEDKKVLTFEEFRDELLIASGVMPRKVDDPLIQEILRTRDKNIVEVKGQTLLEKYSNSFYVIRIVWKIWQKFDLNLKIAKSLNLIKKESKIDTKLLNPLILYLKVREDIEKKRFQVAYDKLFTHIKISSDTQIIQVFEDLLSDMKHNPSYTECLMGILKQVTDHQKIPFSKIKLLILIYLTFCQQVNSPDADAKYMKHFMVQPFHPDDCKDKESSKLVYENAMPLKFKTNTLEGKIEEVRMFFVMNYPERARHLINIFTTNVHSKADVVKFRLASVYLEATYGNPNTALNKFRKLEDPSFNSTFICIHALNKAKKMDALKARFKAMFDDLFTIMNLHAQKLLYRYYQEWSKEFSMFDMLSTPSKNKKDV